MRSFVNKNSLMTLKFTAVSSTLSRVEPEIISGSLRLKYLKIKLYYEQGTMIHVRDLQFPLSLSVKTEPKSSPCTHKILKVWVFLLSIFIILFVVFIFLN